MAQVKVWNDNTHPYSETFKDNKIVIPAGGFIEMEYYEAHELKGGYKAIERDGDNQPLPSSFKMIRVEEPKSGELDSKIELNKCVACAFRGSSPVELHGHILAAHSEQIAKVDEEAEQVMKSKKRAG